NTDHRIGPPGQQKPDRAVAQVPAISSIERNGRSAPQFISDVLVGDRHSYPALAQPRLHLGLDLSTEIDLREPNIAMLITSDFRLLVYFLRVGFFDQSLVQNRPPVSLARCAPLDLCGLDFFAVLSERDRAAPDLFANDRRRTPRRFADSERQVARFPAH